jgi:hypothetical protein
VRNKKYNFLPTGLHSIFGLHDTWAEENTDIHRDSAATNMKRSQKERYVFRECYQNASDTYPQYSLHPGSQVSALASGPLVRFSLDRALLFFDSIL